MLQVLNVTWIQEEMRKVYVRNQQIQSRSKLCAPEHILPSAGRGYWGLQPLRSFSASTTGQRQSQRMGLINFGQPSLQSEEILPKLLAAFEHLGINVKSLSTHVIVR